MKFFNLFIVFFIILSTSAFSKDRGDFVRLSGEVRDGVSKVLSANELEGGLEVLEMDIYNPYEKHSALYGGVLFDAFVKKYAKDGVNEVKIVAIDDYSISIYKSDWESMRIILATRLDKEYIPINKKGPLMVVFPDYDTKKKIYQESISKWIWMIKKIEFK